MIVRQNKNYETHSLYPNSDWENDGNYVIDETTDDGKLLAQRVVDNSPYFDFALDANGTLIDITPTGKPPLPPPEPTELELLKEKYSVLQSAVDFIIMNP